MDSAYSDDFLACGLPQWATTFASSPEGGPRKLSQGPSQEDRKDSASRVEAVFHLSSHSSSSTASIVLMEHNNRKSWTALVTSKKELLVVNTTSLQYERRSEEGRETLSGWNLSDNASLVDVFSSRCAALQWVPWQYGTAVGVFLPDAKEIRIYSFTHNKWVLLDVVDTQDATAFSFSPCYTIALSCRRGRLRLLGRVNTSTGGSECWRQTSVLEEEESADTESFPHRDYRPVTPYKGKDSYECLSWDSSGVLLAVGGGMGREGVKIIRVSGNEFGHTVFFESATDFGRIVDLSWAPLMGQSFVTLAVVHSGCIRLLVFRRSRHLFLTANSPIRTSSRAPQLHLLTSATFPTEVPLRLQWNAFASGFVTVHADGTIRSWDFCVRYEHVARHPAEAPSTTSPSMKEGPSSPEGEPKLALVVCANVVSSYCP